MNDRKRHATSAVAKPTTPAGRAIDPCVRNTPPPGDVRPLAPDTMEKLLRLAALRLGAEERRALEDDLGRIVALIDVMRHVDTGGVAPLAHPLEVEQPLRADVVTEDVQRERMQHDAPSVRDGLYLVPRVVE